MRARVNERAPKTSRKRQKRATRGAFWRSPLANNAFRQPALVNEIAPQNVQNASKPRPSWRILVSSSPRSARVFWHSVHDAGATGVARTSTRTSTKEHKSDQRSGRRSGAEYSRPVGALETPLHLPRGDGPDLCDRSHLGVMPCARTVWSMYVDKLGKSDGKVGRGWGLGGGEGRKGEMKVWRVRIDMVG